jgi:hypothetical protein
VAKTVEAFDFKVGTSGARVVALNPDHVCPGCVTNEEIDTNIRLLKEDLEAVGEQMKAAMCKRGPILPKRR